MTDNQIWESMAKDPAAYSHRDVAVPTEEQKMRYTRHRERVIEASGDCGLLELCQRAHVANTGASDPLCGVTEAEVLDIIEERLQLWEPSPGFTVGFDNAVRNLLLATAYELKQHIRNRETGAKL